MYAQSWIDLVGIIHKLKVKYVQWDQNRKLIASKEIDLIDTI